MRRIVVVALLVAGSACHHAHPTTETAGALPGGGAGRAPAVSGAALLPGPFYHVQWTKPGFDSAEWMRDSRECSVRAREAARRVARATDPPIAITFKTRELFNRCLASRGYRAGPKEYATRQLPPRPTTH